ncbi:alpha/beta fold hydrolase [Parasphingorhabdus sp.]|uniref:alpha/beta fold hydrolase n=1 Tax=Parasphingorhabdus sp. TaxID=2709688 RepID=UPI003BB0BAEF
MSIEEYKGFAGIRLEAEASGSEDDPSILLIHGGGQTRTVWCDVAVALVKAGRRVINLDLRGHGGSEWPTDGRYDFDAYVEDLRGVLAQMGTRPVVVAAALGGWIATVALGRDAATLAAGLVLVDIPTHIDNETSRVMAENIRRRAEQSKDAPTWDLKLMDSFDVSNMPERLADAAPGLNIPVLVVRGALNQMGSGEEAALFVKALPNAEAVEVEDANLLVSGESTEAFDALLLDFLERRQPRVTPEYRSGSDARTLRDALGCFATGVTVVTANDARGSPIGLTANSFTSVSLDPPLLLVCIANTSGSASTLKSASHFAVNVLQIGQQPASNLFAGKNKDRFASTSWEPGETGVPLLTGSLSSFECEQSEVHEGGDHFILVGRVVKASFEPRRDPLLFFRGKYRRLHFA